MWQPKRVCKCGHCKDEHTRTARGHSWGCVHCVDHIDGCDFFDEKHENTDDQEYVVCPYCGHKHGDAWEWCTRENETEDTCDGCGKRYRYWAEFSVDYKAGAALNKDGSDKNTP